MVTLFRSFVRLKTHRLGLLSNFIELARIAFVDGFVIMANMNIVIATPIYPPEIGGPATYTKELVGKLKGNHNLTVVAYTHNGTEIPGSTLIGVEKHLSLPLRLTTFFFAIYKAAKEADVLYVQNAVAAGLPTVLAGLLRKKPVVLKFVGDESWERATQLKQTDKRLQEFLEHPEGSFYVSLLRHVQGFVLRRCDRIITPSQYLGEVITKAYGLKPGKVVTVYNATEHTTEAPFTANKKPHQLVVTARLVEWKGIDGVIKAVAKVKDAYPDVTLIVHGDGPSRTSLEELAKSEGVADRITFTGNVSRTETWHTRKESAMYILNSTYEGLPHTALTSFAAEIPIIATDIPGTNEAVYHEKTGLLVPTDDSEALAKAIKRLFEDQKLSEQLVAGGSQILEEKFSWPAHVKLLTELLESVGSKPIN